MYFRRGWEIDNKEELMETYRKSAEAFLGSLQYVFDKGAFDSFHDSYKSLYAEYARDVRDILNRKPLGLLPLIAEGTVQRFRQVA